MKTIELKAGQQIAQFTTKSVTFDGKEFFYSRMSNLTHDPATQHYYFTYDGEHKILPYEAKDAPILTAIFSQVLKLQAAKASQVVPAAASQKAPEAPQTPDAPAQQPHTAPQQAAPEGIPAVPHTPHVVDVRAAAAEPEESAPQASDSGSEQIQDNPPVPEAAPAEDPIVFTDKKAAKQAEKERKKAEKAAKRAEKERLKAEKAAAKAAKKEPAPAEDPAPEQKAESGETAPADTTESPAASTVDPVIAEAAGEEPASPEDPASPDTASAAEPSEHEALSRTEKKLKLKKSLLIFAAVLVLIAALSVAAYFLFGTSSNPSSTGPNAKESQQYDDIDQLIDDLQ